MENNIIINQTQIDLGGSFDITKIHNKVIVNDIEYSYLASGLCRNVYVSEDKKTVIKIPKEKWWFEHNKIEYEVYRDAPDWCKKNIAQSELLENGYLIQEFVKVQQSNNYYRELGVRESDGLLVVFDCDIFVNHLTEKPKKGFKYIEVFEKTSAFGDAFTMARQIPKDLRKQQKEIIKKYFPNIDNQKFRQLGDTVYIDDIEIDSKISQECGFIE